MMKKGLFLLLLLWLWMIPAEAAYQPQYSVAGFYPLDDTGRTVYSMNPAWRFHKGSAPEAYRWILKTVPGKWFHCRTE